MKLFISYRRKSWPFARQLADRLSTQLDADIFIDFEDLDEADFTASLMRNLRESDAVLLIVSEHTFEARIWNERDWLRREVREALRLRLPIILACVDGLYPPKQLPPDIAEIANKEGVRFFVEYFEAGIERLVAFITRSTPIQRRAGRKSKPSLSKVTPLPTSRDSDRPTLVRPPPHARSTVQTSPIRRSLPFKAWATMQKLPRPVLYGLILIITGALFASMTALTYSVLTALAK
jgi:hypothetical protein